MRINSRLFTAFTTECVKLFFHQTISYILFMWLSERWKVLCCRASAIDTQDMGVNWQKLAGDGEHRWHSGVCIEFSLTLNSALTGDAASFSPSPEPTQGSFHLPHIQRKFSNSHQPAVTEESANRFSVARLQTLRLRSDDFK